jgi:hypothetical protein
VSEQHTDSIFTVKLSGGGEDAAGLYRQATMKVVSQEGGSETGLVISLQPCKISQPKDQNMKESP